MSGPSPLTSQESVVREMIQRRGRVVGTPVYYPEPENHHPLVVSRGEPFIVVQVPTYFFFHCEAFKVANRLGDTFHHFIGTQTNLLTCRVFRRGIQKGQGRVDGVILKDHICNMYHRTHTLCL